MGGRPREPASLAWADAVAALAPLLTAHRRDGERREARADYPVAALFHAGLWDLPGRTGEVPPAHGDAALKAWFMTRSPVGGLPSDVYELVRRSGQARIRIVEAVTARFFAGLDDSGVLAAAGLYDEDLATDEPSPSVDDPPGASAGDAASDYARLCELVGRREAETSGRRRAREVHEPIRLAAARRAVLLRSEGRCENPGCARPAPDVTDQGAPILQVDHIERIADGGRDHPSQMIALCPNCHAVKTLGRSRYGLVAELTRAARERHERWVEPVG